MINASTMDAARRAVEVFLCVVDADFCCHIASQVNCAETDITCWMLTALGGEDEARAWMR